MIVKITCCIDWNVLGMKVFDWEIDGEKNKRVIRTLESETNVTTR